VNTELLGDICEIQKGRKAAELFDRPVEGAHRYLQIDDLRDAATPKFARDPRGILATRKDVVIAWDGANAGTAGFNLEGYIGSTLAALKPKADSEIFAPYLGQFLRGNFDYLQARTTGATIPHVDRDVLESMAVPLPALPEQKRIAAILEKADRLRRTRRYARQLSETFLQSVFVEMFGDPLENRKGFAQGTLGDSVKLFGGYAFQSADFCASGIPLLRIGNANKGDLDCSNLVFLPEGFAIKLKRFLLTPGDLLITLTGTVGKDDYGNLCVVTSQYPRWFLNQRVAKVVLNENRLLKETLLFALRLPKVKASLIYKDRGIRQANLSNDDLYDMRFSFPPLPLQQKFAAIVRRFERLRARQREAERQAEHLFQTLLHAAFSGES
jgi:type I restriction enzyme S subunit